MFAFYSVSPLRVSPATALQFWKTRRKAPPAPALSFLSFRRTTNRRAAISPCPAGSTSHRRCRRGHQASAFPKGVALMRNRISLAFRLIVVLGAALFALAIPSQAQSFDASIGYSYFRLGGGGHLNQNGISGSLEYKPNSFFGLVGDFGGYHASPSGVSVNTYTYMFGPRISVANPTNITPFVQFLIGGAHVTA